MKVINYTVTIILLIASMSFTGCKEEGVDPNVAILNEQLVVLMNGSSSWVLGTAGSVMKDNVDVSNQFAGFKLTIGNKTYTTQNSLSHVWKTSGTWDFQGNNPDLIRRDGSTEVAVSHENNSLTLTFTAAGNPEGGRVNSVSGKYVFKLVSE
jgi:hypothetical protein